MVEPKQSSIHLVGPGELVVPGAAVSVSPVDVGMVAGRAPRRVALPQNDRPYRLFGVLLLLSMFGGAGGWAALAPLSSAAVATGKVTVDGNARAVEHLEGGVVEKVYVEDGDRVGKDQPLIKLSDARARAEYDIVQGEYYDLLAREARLLAERSGNKAIAFPDELHDLNDQKRIERLTSGEKRVFDTRRKGLDSEVAVLNSRIAQSREQIQGLQSVIGSKSAHLRSLQEEVRDWGRLIEKGYADKMRMTELTRRQSVVEEQMATARAEIARLTGQIGEFETQILVRRREFEREVESELRAVQAELADRRTRLGALRDTLERTEIRAPLAGVVLNLNVVTEGEVITPGETVLQIVPEEQRFLVEAQVPVNEGDKVQKGLPADVRFSAFNREVPHVVAGRVTYVSADSVIDATYGNAFYRAKVEITEDGVRQLQADGFEPKPGMPAEVVILTGDRTLLSYLLQPFTDMLARAFRED